MTTTAYIALGSNQGDRQGLLSEALLAIFALPGVETVESSPVYETEPVVGPDDPAEQGKFLNGVAAVQTTLSADELLAHLHTIESDHGRDRAAEPGRNAPRPLDLDIVLFGDQVIDQPGLTVPHPRMHERAFVLQPLCDLAPKVMHPVLKRTAAQLLTELDTSEDPPQRHRDTEQAVKKDC